jgi:DNA-binding transcriptional LysR family regulator
MQCAMPSMSPVLPVLTRLVREKYPGLHIDAQFIGNDAMMTGLSNFELDVVLTYLDKPDLRHKHTLPIYTEQLSLLVPASAGIRNRNTITWREAADLPLAMLRPSMHERRFVDQVFAQIGRSPVARVESESILHLIFQVQFTELCTIIPSHFAFMPGLHNGTRALPLIDPIVSQEVGLFWGEGEVVMPVARAFIEIVRDLNESGKLRYLLMGERVPVGLEQRRTARRDGEIRK